MSDERPKKSWREIDRMRDGGGGRDDRPQASRFAKHGRGQRAYRAALDRLFESGKIAEMVEERGGAEAAAPIGPEETQQRLKLMRAVRDAVGRDAITEAVDALLATGELPRDFDILGQALEHRRPEIQLRAMALMRELLEAGERPRRARAIIGKLKLIRDTADDEELTAAAEALLDAL